MMDVVQQPTEDATETVRLVSGLFTLLGIVV